MKRVFLAIGVGSLLAACASEPAPKVMAPPQPIAATAPANAPLDPLGPRPEVALPPPFTPPAPTVFTTANGINVWLLEKHALPVVSVTLAVPYGSANDPAKQGGVAYETANMMDEGAGALGALDLARAVEMLGASLSTAATNDYSDASLTVLKRNLEPAMAIFADVITRPKFDPKEWARVHELWTNDLKERASEPSHVLGVAAMASLFPADNAYAHPIDGTIASAKNVSLGDVKKFYASTWRPDRASVAFVGDVTRAEVEALMTKAFGGWKAPKASAPAIATPGSPTVTRPAASEGGNKASVILVDREDAPQSVIAFVRPSVAAGDPDAPILSRVNVALGGSFTSRLNQDLREEHGWSYGAHSRLKALRGTGAEIASAAVQTKHTAEALTALLNDVRAFAKDGLTDDEVKKTRLQARSEVVEAFEETGHAAALLARDAVLGLGPDYEAKASRARDEATKDVLDKAAARYFDSKDGFVVIVGPRAEIEAPLRAAGLAPTEIRDAEGAIVAPTPAKKKAR